ncbi:MAG: thioredoxin family protein [Verrucomicrobiaceae bacterium]|nr:thioredoxin family protein [Verrucomicrobiaceae bacterium]
MKSSFVFTTLAVVILSLTQTFAKTPVGWTDDYAKAKAEKKLVRLDFTGSDWCGWCMKLDKEVFDKGPFKNFAKDNLVLVKVDFPRSTPISAKTKAQNEKLQSQFAVTGYPTLFILNTEGKQVWKGGYMEGGPDAFIKAVDGVVKKKE